MPKEEFTDISTDESGARELISFILYLFEADRPVPQTTLQRIFCAEKSHEAARKKLGRFCERAKMLGITIKKTGNFSTGTLEIDPISFYSPTNLPPEDTLLGFIKACEALLAGNTLPYADTLRMTLAKLDPTFVALEMPFDNKPSHQSEKSRILDTLFSALDKTCAVEACYEDALAHEKTLLLAPFGRFAAYGSEYFVAAQLSQNDTLSYPPKTYRIDRFKWIRLHPEISFEIPANFSIQDFYFFPFEFGSQDPTQLTFKLMKNTPIPLQRQLKQRAIYEPQTDCWSLSVRNISEAVVWAIANDILPVAPQPFVSMWKEYLLGGVNHYANK